MKTFKITITEVEAQPFIGRRSSGISEKETTVLSINIPEEANMKELKAAILGALYTQTKRAV